VADTAQLAPALIGGICELTPQTADPAGLARFYAESFDLAEIGPDALGRRA
jgi:hypothetical protein